MKGQLGHGPLLAAVEAHARQEAVAAAGESYRGVDDPGDRWPGDPEPYDDGWEHDEPR